MGKCILVTGSAKGIGAEIIRIFAKCGYNCVINYNTSEKEALELKKEIDSYDIKSLVIKADISKENEVETMFREIESNIGTVDILVNNAAVDLSNLFNLKKIEDFKKTMDVNVIGAFIVSRRAAKNMIKNKWGRIINISSTNGMNTYYPMCIEYDCSKAALNQLTHDLSMQYKPYINVNAIAPGFIGTETELKDYPEEFLKEEVDKIFVGRYGDPKDVANLAKFLASDEASFINNTIIKIDGGQYGD